MKTITEPPHATPTIHNNGTSAKSLRGALEDAYGAASDVLDLLTECRPNARDYYVTPGTMDAAIAQSDYRENLIHALRESIEEEIGRIDQQVRR